MIFKYVHYVANIDTTLRSGCFGSSNPGKGKRFFSSSKYPHRLWGPPSLLLNGYRGFLLWVNQSQREVNHSPPSSPQVKNEWNYTSTSPMCIHVTHRESFSAFTKTVTMCAVERWEALLAGIEVSRAGERAYCM